MKRILIKFSGEQLSGDQQYGVDPKVAKYLAQEIKKVADKDIQIVVVVGGGNMVRGAEVAGNGIRRVTADQMGMLSGLINAMALTDIFESEGVATRCLSNLYATQVAESYSYRLAEKHLANKRVLIVAGGSGRPYVTHDTAAVMLALELDCELVIKSTKVDAVYDKDPKKYPEAKKLSHLTPMEAIENPEIKVMDKAALGLAAENGVIINVLNVDQPDNLTKAICGEKIGTIIST